MLKRDKQNVADYTNGVRLRKRVISLVRKHKRRTGIQIGRFVEEAIIEKLKKLRNECKLKR